MSEAPEKIWATPDKATVYMDGSSPLTAMNREFRNAVEYLRSDIAERQIAELRDHRNAMEVEHRQAIEEMQSALADKARLREALERMVALYESEYDADAPFVHPYWLRVALSGSGAGGWRAECATEGCGRPATTYFERGGVGSHYCHDCYMRVQSLPAAPTATGGRDGE